MPSLMSYVFKKLGISIKTVGPYNHKSLQAEHGIKSLSNILSKCLTGQGQTWHKFLSLATLAYNIFHTPNLGNYSPYELVFRRRPKRLQTTQPSPEACATSREGPPPPDPPTGPAKVLPMKNLTLMGLINIETDLDIKVSGTYKDYHTLLTKRLDYLQNMLQNFRMECLALLNKDREYFQYNSGDLVSLISPLTTQLRTSSRKVAINYVQPLVVYKIID